MPERLATFKNSDFKRKLKIIFQQKGNLHQKKMMAIFRKSMITKYVKKEKLF
jgi:hypothetical protein